MLLYYTGAILTCLIWLNYSLKIIITDRFQAVSSLYSCSGSNDNGNIEIIVRMNNRMSNTPL